MERSNDYTSRLIKIKAEIQAECQARIEALIEAYDGMLDGMGKNSIDHFKVSDWNYVQDLKATHTSGEAINRNTSTDPETGME